MWIWPLGKPWTFTPVGYICAIVWNICEIFGIAIPKPHIVFGLIIGRKPNKRD